MERFARLGVILLSLIGTIWFMFLAADYMKTNPLRGIASIVVAIVLGWLFIDRVAKS